jgi:hypothetical protein
MNGIIKNCWCHHDSSFACHISRFIFKRNIGGGSDYITRP